MGGRVWYYLGMVEITRENILKIIRKIKGEKAPNEVAEEAIKDAKRRQARALRMARIRQENPDLFEEMRRWGL